MPQVRERREPIEARCVPEVDGEVAYVHEALQPVQRGIDRPPINPKGDLGELGKRGRSGVEQTVGQRLHELQQARPVPGEDGRDRTRIGVRPKHRNPIRNDELAHGRSVCVRSTAPDVDIDGA